MHRLGGRRRQRAPRVSRGCGRASDPECSPSNETLSELMGPWVTCVPHDRSD